MPRLLLLSNSTMPGTPFLQWALPTLQNFLKGIERVGFIPYAAVSESHDAFHERVTDVLSKWDIDVVPVHREHSPREALLRCDAVAVGGGNTFRLLERMRALGLVEDVRRAVASDMRYVGWSAGANVACPSIMTTNDMPVIDPGGLDALGLVDFQINPHFTDDVLPNHGGESRAARLQEFTALNKDAYVVGLREGAFLEVSGGIIRFGGVAPLEVFHGGMQRVALQPGEDLSFLRVPASGSWAQRGI